MPFLFYWSQIPGLHLLSPRSAAISHPTQHQERVTDHTRPKLEVQTIQKIGSDGPIASC